MLLAPSPCCVNDGDYRSGFEPHAIDGLLASMQTDYDGWARAMAPMIMGNPDRPELAEVGRWMHARMPADTLIRMEATGHCPHASAPAETIAAIRGFLG